MEIGKRPAMTENRYVIHLHDGTILNYFVLDGYILSDRIRGPVYQLSDYCEDQLHVLAAAMENINLPVKVYDANGVLLDESKVLLEIKINTHYRGMIYLILEDSR